MNQHKYNWGWGFLVCLKRGKNLLVYKIADFTLQSISPHDNKYSIKNFMSYYLSVHAFSFESDKVLVSS